MPKTAALRTAVFGHRRKNRRGRGVQTPPPTRARVKEELKQARQQINELEQYSRRSCLDITGVPEKPNENTTRIVLELAKAVGAEIDQGDIDVSRRVGNRPLEKPVRSL